MPYYITQKVMEAIDVLIGQNTSENFERLTLAALKARQATAPGLRDHMSPETLQHLSVLESDPAPEFDILREAFVGYVISTQRDAAIREAALRASIPS